MITRWHIESADGVVPQVRRQVREELICWKLGTVADDVILMTSELVANAITHGEGPVMLVLQRRQDWLICRVRDGSSLMPDWSIKPNDVLSSGRGLQIIKALSVKCGAWRNRNGKTVWFRVKVT